MEKLLNEILKSDKEAQKRLAEAEEYRRGRLAELQKKKKEIEKEEIAKAVDALLKKDEKQKNADDRQISSLEKSHRAAEEKMNELYEKNGSEWVSRIVDGVING